MMGKGKHSITQTIESKGTFAFDIGKISKIISVFFTGLFCLVIASTFIPHRIVDNYFELFPIALTIGIVIVIACILLVIYHKMSLNLSMPDILLLVSAVYYLLIYDYGEQLANWKIIYAVLLVLFWFASRIIFTYYPLSTKGLLYGLILMGCVQAIWGILQLYGVMSSNHNIYAVTGSFYNPGPYTGYIAVIFPICLGQLLNTCKAERYMWAVPASLLFCMIPAGLSRSAWGALIVSSLFLLFIHFHWIDRIREYYENHFKKFLCYAAFFFLIVVIMSVLGVTMKLDSAYGRLFIWKNTLTGIVENPLFGHGPRSFPAMYGQQQSQYFAQSDYSDWEERVAGTPEYAFNEYLQLTVEGGIILLVLVCIFAYLTFREGFRKERYSVCAGLLSLYIFSFSSYPMQILPFGIIGIILSSLCVSNYSRQGNNQLSKRIMTWCIGVCLFFISIIIVYRLKDTNNYKEKVFYAQALYSASAYQEAFTAYEVIYKKIWHNPRLLMNYARMLMNQKQYSSAIEVLERAGKVSCDASIFNAKAFCYQQIGDYQQAEIFYKESIHRLPVRIYPYYMLTKLYADSAYFDKKKMEEMATIVLTKKPKKYSNAIREMRDEIRKLSIKNNFNN